MEVGCWGRREMVEKERERRTIDRGRNELAKRKKVQKITYST